MNHAAPWGVLIATLLLVGCSGPPAAGPDPSTTTAAASVARAAACDSAADGLVSAVAAVVATYDAPGAGLTAAPTPTTGPASPAPPTTPTTTPTATPTTGAGPGEASSVDLTGAVATARDEISRHGCDAAAFRADLDTGLATITPQGAIAGAVLARVSATLTGRVGEGGQTRRLGAGDDLAQALAEAGPGDTLVLPAGTVRVDHTLVLLDGVTVRGAGPAATTVTSRAAEAAVLVVTAARVELADLHLALAGSGAVTGVLAGPSSSIALTGVRISGARAGADGVGGAAVQLSGRGDDAAGRGTTLEVTGSQFDANAWAGIAVGGAHRVSVVKSTFARNGQCGVCFLDTSSGSVQDSTFRDNAVALGATGSSRPTWVGDTVTGGTVGVQLDGTARPSIERVTVSGASRAAVIFSGHSAGAITRVTCQKVPYGIVVADTAAPTLGDNGCGVARGR